ncbi:1,4-butanediol diacrylate esterase [Bradyrhizobium sp. CCBAU 11434]|uniref:serine hydrolase domain-containing protein n=1 Tax=unclassified Bradyrhizobium TaxID=2631580 RepID=UPI0023064C35|nr:MULTISPECIES: serine hydrolase domain-containing protein [unclassified Bradyrhizobium]MDA9453564.1 1,4-butanediol diacrylate esterase [Bradyrhizobium sp. CCBAU 21359]MDA9519032.1 1,4-butanediol diacrylate esterase [Bradyrhizobium sp. CCBAU 11434]
MVNTDVIASVLRRATENGDIPGVAAAAATTDGPIFEGGFGARDLTTGEPMTADTVVWIASMTKAITGACAMQLVEQGKLSLDEPLKSVLPQLANPKVLEGFDTGGIAKLRPARRDISLRHLLTHTSGYVYDIWNADMRRYMEGTATPAIISCENAALNIPLMADPGEQWEYGIGIDLAGKAVEAASGQKLSLYMKENLLDPLGMNDTAFKIGEAQRKRLAKIHARTPEGLVSTDTEIPQEPEFEMGGGGLYSTVGDYLKFVRAILGRGALETTRVLKAETVDLMSQNAMDSISCRPMKSAAPPFSNDVDFVDGMKWGLSFLINPTPMSTGRSAGSLAWAGLANSYYWIDPTKKVAGVYATQVLPFFDDKAVATFQDYETAVYRAI